MTGRTALHPLVTGEILLDLYSIAHRVSLQEEILLLKKAPWGSSGADKDRQQHGQERGRCYYHTQTESVKVAI